MQVAIVAHGMFLKHILSIRFASKQQHDELLLVGHTIMSLATQVVYPPTSVDAMLICGQLVHFHVYT